MALSFFTPIRSLVFHAAGRTLPVSADGGDVFAGLDAADETWSDTLWPGDMPEADLERPNGARAAPQRHD